MPVAYRLAKARRSANSAQMLSGDGGLYAAGRWNLKGVRMVYTASSLSLAMLEISVHATGGSLLPFYRMLKVEFPDSIVMHPGVADLPKNWDLPTASPLNVRQWGSSWANALSSAVLRVPSALLAGRADECNYLINPLHADFAKVDVVEGPIDFPFDPRVKQ